MTDRQTIAVAVDFEAASDKALALASELAERLGCDLVLVHVYQLPIYTYPGLEPGVLPAYQSEVTAAAKRALDGLALKHGVKRAFLREGDPATEVLAALEELRPKLAVVGTHGRRGLSHLLLGSVAEKIVRRATVPVVTVRADDPAKG
jgi:nucleotide-binding universal stress UspA family protein